MPAEVVITEDRLRAVLNVPAGTHLSQDHIKGLIVERGVCVGLQEAALAEALVASEHDRRLTVALGLPPRTRWYYHLKEGIVGGGEPVRSGQILAEMVFDEQRQPRSGMTVDGVALSAPEDSEVVSEIIVGVGVEVFKNVLRSTRGGVFVIQDEFVWRVVDDPRGKPKKQPMLFLADDYHSAWVRLERGEYIPMNILRDLLREKEVSYGLIPQALNAAAKGATEAATYELARGIYPQAGEDGRVEYCINDEILHQERDDGSYDFWAAKPIIEVERGEVLMRIFPPQPGKVGMDVRGKRLDYQPGREMDPERYCGEGVEAVAASPDDGSIEIRAAVKGVYNRLVTGKVQVHEQVVIDGDVDMSTGHVESQYPICIKGDIQAGFSVKSACDIMVEGSIEDARVSAQGNLQVKGGILPGKNRVKAHGDVQARFIEGRHIKCRTLLVQSAIRHSTVYATGAVEALEILGGQVVAAENITIKEAGNDHERPMTLQAGVDPMQQAEFDDAVALKAEIDPQIRRLQQAVQAAINHATDMAKKVARHKSQSYSSQALHRTADQAREALRDSQQIRQQLEDLEARQRAVQETMDAYEKAASRSAQCSVKVSGTAHPGVEIRIGRHARTKLHESVTNALFRVQEGVVVW
ncbi:MAG: DUF342 domain-containing protein [Planctomycetota bacterium]|nr:MAG: DUF342 domain-containing protein [Planctomycetota bacterium]